MHVARAGNIDRLRTPQNPAIANLARRELDSTCDDSRMDLDADF